jgi:phosphate:Na+ symporter
MWQVIIGALGGMGLFFVGLKLTGEGVKKISGRRFRDLFLKWTRRTPQAAAVGVAAGFVFQSTSGLSLLLASLIGAGITTVGGALPVMLGANAGCSLLVLVAVLDIKLLILALLGFSGFIIAFERPLRLTDLAGIVFGVALLLFGLETVRASAAPLAQSAWFKAFVSRQGLPLPVYFGIGTVASLLLQTSAGVSILAITLATAGILDANDALAIIYGSLFGSSLLTRFYAIQLTGAQKRLNMGQVYFNFIGLAVFLPLFILENYAGVPLVQALAAWVFPGVPQQLTAINISFDCFTALGLLSCVPAYERFLARRYPDGDQDQDALALARALSDVSPETALLLLNREQDRLTRNLPAYTARLREALERNTAARVHDLHQTVESLSSRLDEGLVDMVARGQADANANAVALLQGSQATLRSVSETLRQIVAGLSERNPSPDMRHLAGLFLEALDTQLGAMGEAFSCQDEDRWDLVQRMVGDKRPIMERIRGRYLNESGTLTADEKWRLLRVTGLFERCVWLLSRLGEQQRRFLAEMGEAAAAMTCARGPDAASPA